MMIGKIHGYWLVLLAGLLTAGCSRDYLEPSDMSRSDGLTVTLGTDGNGTYAVGSDEVEKIMSDLKFFAFQRGGGADGAFSHQVVNLRRTGATTLQGPMRTGDWYLAAVAAPPYKGINTGTIEPSGAVIIPPAAGAFAASSTMYLYRPFSTVSGRSSSCHEIWFRNVRNLPTITLDGNHTAQTAVARNVAGLTFHVDYPAGKHPEVDPEWGVSADGIVIKLHNVPTTLSWEGKVLPDKSAPATFDKPLINKPGWFSWGSGSSIHADYPMWVIPAHRGSDFWAADGLTMNGNAADTLMKKLMVEVEIIHKNGQKTIFGPKPLPLVPKCNRQMDISLTLTAHMDIEVTELPWNVEEPQGEMPTEPDITNCYIVKPGRGVTIPVAGVYKAWNGRPELVVAGSPMDTSKALTAEVIWETEPGLVEQVRMDNPENDWLRSGVVVKTAAGKEGNALVGIRMDGDPAGDYRWSWHIWAADYDPETSAERVENTAGVGFTLMDRNLGALIAEVPGLQRANNVTAEAVDKLAANIAVLKQYEPRLGLFYQWGRKDPVPLQDPAGFQRTVSDIGTAHDRFGEGALQAERVLHPGTYYRRGASASAAETVPRSIPGGIRDFWGAVSGKKSIYDPCPAGWKVLTEPAGVQPYYWSRLAVWENNLVSVRWNDTDIRSYQTRYYDDNMELRGYVPWTIHPDGYENLEGSQENSINLWLSKISGLDIPAWAYHGSHLTGFVYFTPGAQHSVLWRGQGDGLLTRAYPVRCIRDTGK